MDATAIRKLRTSIQQMAGTFNKDLVDILLCTVDSISSDGFTCSCTPISGKSTASIPGVKLNAEKNDGFLITPTIGSTVLVATSTRNNYYVFLYSDIDKITCIIDTNNSYEFDSNGFIWNDGLLGGMVKINDLKIQLTTIQTEINTLKTAITALMAGYAPIDGGVALAAFSAIVLPQINLTTLEDTKIKH